MPPLITQLFLGVYSMKNFCLVLCLFNLFFGCSDKRKYSFESISANDGLFIIDIDACKKEEALYLSNYFHSVHATILDDIPEASLGTISKMASIVSLFTTTKLRNALYIM